MLLTIQAILSYVWQSLGAATASKPSPKLVAAAAAREEALHATLPDETMKIINATVAVVAENIQTITKTFYPKMFANNPEVLAFFNMANQRSSRQPEALAHSIVASVTHINNLKDIEGALELIAYKHCALGVYPEHYHIVHDNFMAAVAEVLGSAVTPEIGQAWSDVVMHVAKACIAMEAEIYEKTTAELDNWDAKLPKPFVVAKVVKEADDAKSFYLKPKDGTAPPTYLPGQYVTLCLKTDEPVTAPRHYTISSAKPVDGCIRITVKHAAAEDNSGVEGIVSSWLHANVKQGDVLNVRPPFGPYTRKNNTWDQEVYITAGSGVTPAIAMLPGAAKACSKVAHFHVDRKQSRHALSKESKALNLAVCKFVYDDAHPRLTVGQMLKDLKAAGFDMAGSATGYHITGPAGFVRAMAKGLKAEGVDASCVRHEVYGPAIDV